ncbi:MAG: hypothetical protein ABIH85_00665 [Candidatus Omnitrophota bacterium]
MRCIDVMPRFKNSKFAPKDLYLFYDPMHLSKKGNKILFDAMESDMKETEVKDRE